MKVISSDGLGVGALLRTAREIQALLVDSNIHLGVVDIDGEDVAYVTGKAHGYRIGVTVEPTPRLVDLGQPEAPKARSGSTHPGRAGTHYDALRDGRGSRDCLCIERCCSGVNGQCVCLTCEDTRHDHG